MDIICLGELLIDMMPAEIGRKLVEVSAFQPKPGGAPANVAVAASRLGARAAFVGKVGDEAFGHYLAEVLGAEGVDVSGMRFDPEARTPLAFIALPNPDTQEILFYRNPGADTRLRVDELDADLLKQARAFHFGSLSLIQEPSRSATLAAARMARGAGALVSFDVNYRPNLWGREEARQRVLETLPEVDLVKVNEGELELITGRAWAAAGLGQVSSVRLGEAAMSLLACGPQICIVTLGPHGGYFQLREHGGYVPGFKVQAVDTLGCGDAFIAGLLCRLIRGNWREQLTAERMLESIRYANAVGALTALRKGVIPALPFAAEVEQFLVQHDVQQDEIA